MKTFRLVALAIAISIALLGLLIVVVDARAGICLLLISGIVALSLPARQS